MDYKFVELKQRHIEAFANEMPVKIEDIKIPVYNRMTVCAALKAGWFADWAVNPDAIMDMSPREVGKIARLVMQEYTNSMEVSPE